jgi:hypothetical protein
MKTSLLKLRNESKTYFDAHKQVKSFFWGDFIRFYAENQIKHSAVIIQPLRLGELSRHQVTAQLVVTYTDRVFSDFSNLDEVHSQAADVLNDFVMVLNTSPRWKDFVIGATNGNAEFFTQRSGDLVAGAAMILNVRIKSVADLCAIPTDGYDYEIQPEPLPPAGNVRVVNSNGEYDVLVNVGGILELPDTPVTVVDQNNNELSAENVPSVTGGQIEVFIEPCSPCEDATVQINGDEVATVASGGMVNVSVENESGTPIGSFDEETGVWVIPDCDPVTFDITRDGQPFESGSEPSGGSIAVDVPSYQNRLPTKTGQNAIYATGDDGDEQRARLTNFFILDDIQAILEHSFRFTGRTGGYHQRSDNTFRDRNGNVTTKALAFPDDIMFDWAHTKGDRNSGKVMRWYLDPNQLASGQRAWQPVLDNIHALNIGGLTNWDMPNMNEVMPVMFRGSTTNNGLNNWFDYEPFNNTDNNLYWMNEGDKATTPSTTALRLSNSSVVFQGLLRTTNSAFFRMLAVSYSDYQRINGVIEIIN